MLFLYMHSPTNKKEGGPLRAPQICFCSRRSSNQLVLDFTPQLLVLLLLFLCVSPFVLVSESLPFLLVYLRDVCEGGRVRMCGQCVEVKNLFSHQQMYICIQ